MKSNYAENKKKIEVIRNQVGDMAFRMAISHLMDVGLRHLTEENVEKTCKELMQQDDSKSLMSNAFQCSLVRTAYALAQIPHIDLLVYIQREVVYAVDDGMPDYDRAITLLKACMSNIEQWNACSNELTLGEFEDIGFDDDEIRALKFGYVLDAREEEEEND
jgi:hypothetical protein